MTLKKILITIMILSSTPSFCQKKLDYSIHHFCVSVDAGLGANYDTWLLEAKGEYTPIPFLGVAVGMNFLDLCRQDEHLHIESQGRIYEIDEYSTFMYHLIFHPAIKLYSPAIKLDNVGDKLIFSVGYGFLLPLSHRAKGYGYLESTNRQPTGSNYSPIEIRNKDEETMCLLV